MATKKKKQTHHKKADADCAHKLVFDTKKQAQAMATTLNHQRGNKLHPYSCSHCELWHLTSD